MSPLPSLQAASPPRSIERLIRLCVLNAVHIAGPQSMISVTEVEHRI